MIDFGRQRSAIKPDEIMIDEFSVWIYSDIKELSEPGIDDQECFTAYEFNMLQYSKDEYIKLMSEKNKVLENELTDTQIALCDIFEMLED